MNSTQLHQRYPIRRVQVLRNVIGKLFVLAVIGVFVAKLFRWKTGGGELMAEDVADLSVSSLLFVVLALLILADLVYEWLYIKRFQFYSDSASLTVRRGVLGTSEVTLPFSKITDIYVNQGIVDRLFGVCELHFSTPTNSSGSAARIEGLSKKHCYELRAEILQSIKNES